MRALLVGALAVETLPVARRLGLPGGSRLALGRWRGHEVGLLRCGVGPRRALERTRRALERLDAELVVSFGTCGSLGRPRVGEVHRVGSLLRPGEIPRQLGAGPRCVTVDRAVFDPLRRAELARQGAELVEMEAAAVAEAAGARRFAALKVVSDLASAPPSRLGFALHAWRLCGLHLAPAIEELLADETESATEASVLL